MTPLPPPFAPLTHRSCPAQHSTAPAPAPPLRPPQLELCSSSLSSELHAARAAWAESDIAVVVRHIASALACAHERGMVHLDVKPDNIFKCLPGWPGAGGRAGELGGATGCLAAISTLSSA